MFVTSLHTTHFNLFTSRLHFICLWVEELLIGFLDVAFLLSKACFSTTFLKNCDRCDMCERNARENCEMWERHMS